MKLLAVHVRVSLLELLRYPTFSVPTLLFPAVFFAMFAVPRADEDSAAELLAAYAGFAALGVAFFQFGVGIAAERASPWEHFVRTLPISSRSRFAARLVTALAFSAASIAVVLAVAAFATPVSLAPSRWLVLAGTLAAGSVPFGLLGIAIGYWLPPRGALPVANLLYLGMSYAGGLWIPPEHLPAAVERLGAVVPTRQLTNVLRAAADGRGATTGCWLLLGAWAVVFTALATWGYRRDEGERFR